VANGFSIALQIGGVAGGWMTSCTMPNPHSLFSTGIDLKDYVNKGIYIHDPQGGAGYALAISANAGNVGIGNTSPTEKLTVTDTQTVSVGDGKGNGGAAEIQIKNPAALLLGLDSKINGNEFLRFATDTRRNWIQSFEATAGNTQSAALTLAAGTTRAIEIDNAGNVGVGNVTAPSQKLDVNGNIKCSGQNILPSYTKTALPTGVTGGMIYVTNDIGGAVPAFFDGTNWRRVIDRNVIS